MRKNGLDVAQRLKVAASYDGKSVTYDKLDDMQRRLTLVETWQMQNIQPGFRRLQAGFAVFNRGNG